MTYDLSLSWLIAMIVNGFLALLMQNSTIPRDFPGSHLMRVVPKDLQGAREVHLPPGWVT